VDNDDFSIAFVFYGVILAAMIIGFVLHRLRRRRRSSSNDGSSGVSDGWHSDGDGDGDGD